MNEKDNFVNPTVRIGMPGSIKPRDGGDVVIRGSGVYREGEELRVAGSARADADVAARRVSVAGRLSVKGVLKSETVSVAGTLSARGVECRQLSVAGLARIGGRLVAEVVKIGGRLEAEEILAKLVKVGGAVRAASIEADELEIELGGSSEVEKISAKTVRIRPKRDLMGLLMPSKRKLRAERIEGKQVYISRVTCEEVVGERVLVGPGCRVRRVVYSEAARVSDRARVLELVRAK